VAEAMQSIGKITVNCLNYQGYQTYVEPLVESIYARMTQSTEPQVREAALCFFYNVAGCLKEKFAIFIEKLVGFTINLANLENEVEKSAPKAKKEFSLDSDSEEEDAEANFKMSYVHEKIAAICALGHFA
jgi:hypothetical protein